MALHSYGLTQLWPTAGDLASFTRNYADRFSELCGAPAPGGAHGGLDGRAFFELRLTMLGRADECAAFF